MSERAASEPETLGRFRALLVTDEVAQAALARCEDAGSFVEAALALAARHGIALAASDLTRIAAPDPLGLSRFDRANVECPGWPPGAFLPIQVAVGPDGLGVDWAHFSGEPVDAPFYAAAVRRALARPFNRLMRVRTRLDDFIDAAPADLCEPDGFILHMSRSGSTLVVRMLAALRDTAVISEAAPLDAILHIARSGDWPAERRIAALRAMVGALGRTGGRHFVVKLNFWHALALPLLRAAFPRVPWLFLHRDPAEVIASQIEARGTELTPEIFPPQLYGIEDGAALQAEDYCAKVLARVCEAALAQGETGLFVDYDKLPGAVEAKIMPHFGLGVGGPPVEIAGRDAKEPGRPFRRAPPVADPVIRAAADAHFAGIRRRLEAMRGPQSLL